MTTPVILPVILAGGSGERLWPLSRSAYPKQFLNILSAKVSLFQATLQRVENSELFFPPVVIAHEDHRFLVAEQLRQLECAIGAIILEPEAKNTAAAVALAANWATTQYSEITLLVLPADHYLPDFTLFADAVEKAAYIAKKYKKLVTCGVKPDRPETGYGYIKVGDVVDKGFLVEKFIEKPELEVATDLVQQGCLWNSGIFVFLNTVISSEFKQYCPEIFNHTYDALHSATQDYDFIRADKNYYSKLPSISIDYAIMEHTQLAAVVPFDTTWSDVGSWDAVWRHADLDENANYVVGDVVLEKTNNCLIEARHRLVATADIDNLAIIETSDAVLVAKRDNAQQLKNLVAELKSREYPAAKLHRKVMRPWGYFDSLYKDGRCQVKVLVLQIGKSISLQMHYQRSEHWVVVKGLAKVIKGDEAFILRENESTFIPIGMKHRLINVGDMPLEVVEVQSGNYLGEDDIVRFEEEHVYA